MPDGVTDQRINGSTDQLIPALIIFVRYPERGKVKTRIAAEAGEAAALEVYRRLLGRTEAVVREVAAVKYVFYAGGIPEADLWSAAGCIRLPQADGDLGTRMEEAFRTVLGKGHPSAVIIGSDCPGLTAAIIRNSIDALQGHDLSLGPASDGGYYLLSAKAVQPVLFRDMEWSTPTVLRETLERAARAGLSAFLLPQLDDVDHWDDVPLEWREELTG